MFIARGMHQTQQSPRGATGDNATREETLTQGRKSYQGCVMMCQVFDMILVELADFVSDATDFVSDFRDALVHFK